VSGLVIGAIRPRHRAEALSSRLALGLLLFAFVASLFDRFPFGPHSVTPYFPGISPGSRHSLWLVPVFALGLAVALSRIAARLPGAARPVLHSAAIAASVAVLVLGYGRPVPYPIDEAPRATRVVDEWAASADAVIVADTRVYAHALYTSKAVVLVPTPTHQIGFTPAIEDERFHGLGPWSKRRLGPKPIGAIVEHATDVVVYGTFLGPGSDKFVAPVMRAEGFTAVDTRSFGNGKGVVTMWRRGQTTR
jgi:hypothetical protein